VAQLIASCTATSLLQIVSEPLLLPALVSSVSSSDEGIQGRALVLLVLLLDNEAFCKVPVYGRGGD
jgi:hypothetical protein